MKLRYLCVSVMVMTLAACSDSGGGYQPQNPVLPAPPASTKTDFTNFLSLQFNSAPARENAAPEVLEGREFEFKDQDNPNAFDGTINAAQ